MSWLKQDVIKRLVDKTEIRFFIISILLLSLNLLAEVSTAARFSYDRLDSQFSMEASYQEQLEKIISTRLDEKTFRVGVQVELSEVKNKRTTAGQQRESKIDKSYPQDLSMGIIDINNILDSYEEELKDLEARIVSQQTKAMEAKKRYRVKSVKILVGLHEKYGKEYFTNFSSWLKKYTRKTMGRVAQTQVEYIKEAPIDKNKEEREKATFNDRTPYEKLKDFQWLLVALGLILAFFTLLFLFKKMQSKDAKSEKTLSVKLAPIKLEKEPLPDETEDLEEEDGELELPQVSMSEVQQAIHSYMMKTAMLSLESGKDIQVLLRYWLGEGEDGQIKVALVLDSLVTYKEELATKGVDSISKYEEFFYPLINNYQSDIKEVFAQMSELDPVEKVEVLEEIYWELMSLKTLGAKSLQKPFDYLEDVSSDNVKNLLEGQDEKTAAVALLHLGSDQREKVLQDFDYEKKKRFIKTLLSTHEILEDELLDMETSVKLSAKSLESVEENGKVNLFPQTTRILRSLPPNEELLMLRQVTSDLPDGGENLRKFYPTVAFVDQWKEEFIQKLCSRVAPSEVMSLVTLLPDTQSIVEFCPPKVQTIVNDDLQAGLEVSKEQLDKDLNSLRKKMNKFLNEEKVALMDVYAVGPVEEKRAA